MSNDKSAEPIGTRLVCAERAGFYGNQRVREGVTFTVTEAAFAADQKSRFPWLSEAKAEAHDEIAARHNPRPVPIGTAPKTRRAVADRDAVRTTNVTPAVPAPAPGKSVL